MTRAQVASQLAALTILIAVARLYTYHEPVEMDAATYAVVAHELRDGRSLYTDLWDHKPPAVHATFVAAQAVFGYGPGHVYALGVLVAVLTLVGVFAAASVPPFGSEIGLWAAAFWALISGDMYLQANQPNTEVFQNLCLVWGFALLLRLPYDRRALGRAAAIGALFALASLYKHVALVTAGMLVAAHVLMYARAVGRGAVALGLVPAGEADRSDHEGRDFTISESIVSPVVIHAGVITTVIATMWAAVCGYFALTGRFADFYGAVFLFNRQYSGSAVVNLMLGFTPTWLLPRFMYVFLPLIVIGVLGAFVGRELRSPRGVLLAAYALGTVVAVALPGRFFEHYYQLWLPVLAIAAAWGIAALAPITAELRRWQARAALAVALVLLAGQLPYYRLAPQEWSVAKFGGRLINSRYVASMINEVLLPGETFYEWGHEAELYFYSSRRPPGSELRSEHLLSGPRGAERSHKLVADLSSAAPELLLVSERFRFPLEHEVPNWLMQHYVEFGPERRAQWSRLGYRAFYRRGGDLERRLAAEQRQTAAL
jgi:hypothetical protein